MCIELSLGQKTGPVLIWPGLACTACAESSHFLWGAFLYLHSSNQKSAELHQSARTASCGVSI